MAVTTNASEDSAWEEHLVEFLLEGDDLTLANALGGSLLTLPAAGKPTEASSHEVGAHTPQLPDPKPEPPAARRSRGRKKTLSEEEKRLKNRAIQARYRANQRSRQENLLTEHSSLAADLERERAAHAAALQRNAVLEKLACSSGFYVDALRVLRGVEDPGSTSDEDGVREGLQRQRRRSSDSLPGLAAAVAPTYSGLVQDLYNSVAVTPESGTGVADALSDSLAGPLVAEEQYMTDDGRLAAKIVALVKTRTPEQIINCWRAFAARLEEIWAEHEEEVAANPELGPLDLANEAQSVTAAMQECGPLMQKQGIILGAGLVHNPEAIRALFATGTMPGESEAAALARWRNIVAQVGFTPAQHEQLDRVWREFLAAQREQQAVTLRAMQSLSLATQPPADTLRSIVSNYLSVASAAGPLFAAPGGEVHSTMKLMRDVTAVMTVAQRARMVVLANQYGSFTDFVQWLTAVKGLGGVQRDATMTVD